MHASIVFVAVTVAALTAASAAEPDFAHAPLWGPGDMLQVPKPDWPYEARSRGGAGAVTLGFIIGPDGVPQGIHVISTTASAATTKAAVAWLRSCKGNPARRGKVLRTVIQFSH